MKVTSQVTRRDDSTLDRMRKARGWILNQLDLRSDQHSFAGDVKAHWFGWINSNYEGGLSFIDKIAKAPDYVNAVDECYPQWLAAQKNNHYHKDVDKIVVVHDNGCLHTSDDFQDFAALLKDHFGIEYLPFPPYSADPNIIENVWAEVERRLQNRARTEYPKMEELNPHQFNVSYSQLRRWVLEAFDEVVKNQSYMDSLYDSIIGRMKRCNESRGCWTSL